MRFYKYPQSDNRLVSAEEIASACCVSKARVHDWTVAGLLTGVAPSGTLFEAASVVQFLVTSRLPVPHSLLPPRTRRVLFVFQESDIDDNILRLVHTLCSELATSCNILLESCATDSRMNLFILQGQPDLIIRYIADSPNLPEKMQFPEDRPHPKIVVICSDEFKQRLLANATTLQADLVLGSGSLSVPDAILQINLLFEQ